MHRLPGAVARFLFVIVVGVLATAAGTLGALVGTAAGKGLLARLFTAQSVRLVRGSVSIARIEGNFYDWLALDSVVIRDTTGFPLAALGRVEMRFRLADVLAGRIVLERLRLIRPRIYLVKHRVGRLNFEEVLKLGEGTGEPGPAKLIEFRNVAIDDGIVTVRTPWSPAGHLRTGAQRDSALHAQRTTVARRIEDGGPIEGLQQVRTVEGLYARIPRLQISTPARDPVTLAIDSLALALNDPLVEVRDLAGELRQARDTLWFELSRIAFPNTRGGAEGLLAWPQDTLLFNYEFTAPQVDLADLRFVSQNFPAYTGSGRLQAYSFHGNETQYDIRDLDVGTGTERVRGRLIAVTHRFRGLGFRGLDLVLANLDLDVVRPYLDTLPFEGRLSGRLQADGFFDDMRIAVDWSFFDDRAPSTPLNFLTMRGPVTLGGPEGFVFHNVQVDSADLDLPTVQLAIPSVILHGRASGDGSLDGAWRNATFTGRLTHQDGDRPPSHAAGRMRFDTRQEMVVVDADLTFTPLDFEGVRPAFPALTSLGGVSGPVRLLGPLDRMTVWADLQGAVGNVKAEGVVAALPPRWEADSLVLDFSRADLHAVRGTGPSTRLAGRMVLRGVLDSLAAPEGNMDLALQDGWVREIELDSVRARLAVRDSVIVVDTASVWLPGIELGAGGTLGWVAPHTGALGVVARAERLAALDSLLAAALDLEQDTTLARQPLDGTGQVQLALQGALDSLVATGDGHLRSVRWNTVSVPEVGGRFTWAGGERPHLGLGIEADTMLVGRMRFAGLQLQADGPADSLQWTGGVRGGGVWEASGRGELTRQQGTRLGVRQVEARLRDKAWRAEAPFSVEVADSVWTIADARLSAWDGSGRVSADGSLPNRGPGSLDLEIDGLDLRDVYALLQRDTTVARGTIALGVRISGTARDPVMRGTGNLTGPVFGDFRAPLGRLAFSYQRRRLDGNLTFWRTGRPLMDVDAALPLDLSWSGDRTGPRQLPGPLTIRARADSMDLAVVEAFTRNLRQVRGVLAADVVVQGTWETPRLGGTVSVRNGSAQVPNLGVRYGPFLAQVTLSGDSILVDTMEVRGREGQLHATGHVRLDRLTRPVLGLDFHAQNFVVMDVRDYLSLQADGDVRLRGPLFKADMTGTATARNSVLYFADLVTKSIVNLEDPLFEDLVDTAAIRRRGLGAAFQSRFLDSLTITNFAFQAAEGVWLRSNEANIQLEGGVTVQKHRQIYRLDGSFNAIRGTYNLKLPFITRGFDVSRGVVSYRGRPDLDADLDVEARHLIRPADAEGGTRDIEVIARIQGSLAEPKLTLESSIRPPLSQSDIITLLLLRRAVNSGVLSAGQSAQVGYWAAVLASTLTSEFERSVVQESGTGIDLVEIRPGVTTGLAGQATLSRIAAGWQLGNRWFVSLTAGFCPQFQQFDYRNFGASLDYRLGGTASLSVSAEPIQTCLAGATSDIAPKRYQFGADLRWSRDY